MLQGPIGPDDVKKLRKRLGLKQRELAEVLNVMPYVVSNWETGKHRPTGTAAKALAMLLSERDGPSGGDAAHEGGAGAADLSIRLLVETLRWLDEHGAPDPGLVRSLRELVEGGASALRAISRTEGIATADLERGAVAAGVIQHCLGALGEVRGKDTGRAKGRSRRG